MARILRGEIRLADLGSGTGHEQSGMRPVLVLSAEVFNERSGTVIAAAVTSQPQRAGFPLTLPIEHAELPKRSWVKISQVRTISTARLGRTLATLPAADVDEVVEGLNEILAP